MIGMYISGDGETDFLSSNCGEDVVFASIEVKTLPAKMSYADGESLDLTGMEVIGRLTNGAKVVLDSDEYTVSPVEADASLVLPASATSDKAVTGSLTYPIVYREEAITCHFPDSGDITHHTLSLTPTSGVKYAIIHTPDGFELLIAAPDSGEVRYWEDWDEDGQNHVEMGSFKAYGFVSIDGENARYWEYPHTHIIDGSADLQRDNEYTSTYYVKEEDAWTLIHGTIKPKGQTITVTSSEDSSISTSFVIQVS